MAQSNHLIYDTAGIRITPGACVVLVKTEWNAAWVDELARGAAEVLELLHAQVETLVVPGAVEIPFAIRQYWESKKYSAKRPAGFIALGCVLRGDTPHFEYVCQSVTAGITQLNIQLPVPCIFGVLTVNTETQIQERLGGIHGHKGQEAGITALKMIALNESLNKRS
jgi:6,7-dimethyl-8-ribityllumazine synthase